MSRDTQGGWNASASAWIEAMGEAGDYGRRYVLDQPMLARIRRQPFTTALDVGCGEGRFCRMMQALGLSTIGIEPTQALIDHARQLDPSGDYRTGRAEDLGVSPGSFDLVVSYLSLVDIADLATAITIMAAALRPSGTLLIANLTSFNTAGMPDGWTQDHQGKPHFSIDNYLQERAVWVAWRGIRIQNWHRPLSTYMTLLLQAGLELRHFAEPQPAGGDAQKAARYCRVPYFHIMEWQKPDCPAPASY